jgi:hypothetical protein
MTCRSQFQTNVVDALPRPDLTRRTFNSHPGFNQTIDALEIQKRYPGDRAPGRGAINMPGEIESRSDKKFAQSVLVRDLIVRTSGCRLLLVSVVSAALGPIKCLERGAQGNCRAIGQARDAKIWVITRGTSDKGITSECRQGKTAVEARDRYEETLGIRKRSR